MADNTPDTSAQAHNPEAQEIRDAYRGYEELESRGASQFERDQYIRELKSDDARDAIHRIEDIRHPELEHFPHLHLHAENEGDGGFEVAMAGHADVDGAHVYDAATDHIGDAHDAHDTHDVDVGAHPADDHGSAPYHDSSDGQPHPVDHVAAHDASEGTA